MLKRQRIFAFILIALLLLAAIPALAFPGDNSEFRLGNCLTSSLHGGQILEYGYTLYWADHTGIYANDILLTDEPGRHLNVMGGGLYFVTGDEAFQTLRRYDLESGRTSTAFSWSAPIDQLLISGDRMALFVSEGQVHRIDFVGWTLTTDQTDFYVTRFIPTAYGTIYATGSLGDYTLYAGDRLIEAGVTIFFTEDEDLIVRRGTEDYQAAFSDLFCGPGPIMLSAYEPRIEVAPQSVMVEDDPADDGEYVVDAFLVYDDTIPFNIVQPVATTSLPLTQSQRNVVLRARQQLEIRWTPLRDVVGWRGNTIFPAGVEQVGIPYAQPIHSGRYIPWGITPQESAFEHFRDAVLDINSNMYTSFSYNGTHATRAPFYGSDCSSFVAWAVNHPRRTTTWTFPNYATRITRQFAALQVGDVFNSSGHNILVTAVDFDLNGNVVAIETMEQTVPLPRHRRWGAGGNSTLPALLQMLNNQNYHFYRPTTIGDVPFTPSPAVDVSDGMHYTITAVAGPGGVISPAGLISVPHGQEQRFVFQPDPNHRVTQVLVNGVDQGAISEFTFRNVTADARIEVHFALSSTPFWDVEEHHWFYGAVRDAFRDGLVQGTSDTHFSPHLIATRAEFATVVGRLAGVNIRDWARPGIVTTVTPGSAVNVRSGPTSATNNVIGTRNGGSTVQIIGQSGNWYRILHGTGHGYMSRDFVVAQAGRFPDVAAGAWYAPFVEWAGANGVVAGIGDGRFNPAGQITRQEMATILHNYTTQMDIPLSGSNIPPFFDFGDIDAWARAGVTAMQRAGVVQGDEHGRFHPQNTGTRAEMTQMIIRVPRG